jgi:arylsulfatase
MVWDDVGYGQMSAFGGLCETPTLDRIASRGLRYANFQTTALCSPTRGCVLTGRNHHTLGLGAITELSIGYPALNGIMGFEHGMLSEILLEAGYNTFAVGKWHLAPPEETTMAGPFGRWPLGRGFERFYGFMGGDTDQWFPDLIHDNHPVRPPCTPEEGYHLNVDLADRAIEFIQDAHVTAPDKPFLLYYCPGAGHAPHHVEPEWIEKYRGAFDDGWDRYREVVLDRQKALGIVDADAELPPRDPDVPAWDSLGEDARRMYAHQMEVYAGFIEQTDHHFGRVIDFIERTGELDNTIVVVISDNGASAEGGEHGTFNETLFFNLVAETLEDNLEHYDQWGSPDTFCHYAWGWAWAGDTPFRRWKRETYRGGITDPCLVSWPAGITAAGEVRHQYCHAIDLLPTLLDALGLDAPATIRGVPQSPLQGVSFAHTFEAADAASLHVTQYFEMLAHRSLYHDGWKAVCPFPGPSFAEGAAEGLRFGQPLTAEILDRLDATGWELYDLRNDPCEVHDLALDRPDLLRSMVQRWYSEAGRHGVLPIAAAELSRLAATRPKIARSRDRITFYPGGAPLAFAAAPRLVNRRYSITARVAVPDSEVEGVLLTQGSRHAGFAFFMDDGHLRFVHNYVGLRRFGVSSAEPVAPGEATLRFEFEPTTEMDLLNGRGPGGLARLFVDGALAGASEWEFTTPIMIGVLGMSCGYAAFDSVDPSLYSAPFPFTGTIHDVVVDTSGELTETDEQQLQVFMAKQ